MTLFGPAPRHSPGRVRRGLDREVRDAGADLSPSGVAALRSLADQIDILERALRHPEARPYDRIPLAALVKQFDDTWARTFPTDETLPDALAEIVALAKPARNVAES